MIEKFIAIYVFIDDIMIEIGHKEPVNRNSSDSELIAVALIAAKYFHGNIDHAINFVKCTNLLPGMLSKSRFNRRIHSIFELIIDLFLNTADIIKRLNISSEYIIDSFPVATCENIRICRSKLIKGKQYRGYKPSMRKYFYGFTVQVITTVDGIPVEFAMLPGCYHDIDGMKNMFFNLPEDSTVYGDSAYTDYYNEQVCSEAADINLMIARKSNTKLPHEPWQNFLISDSRKRIETTFSQISSMLPKRIHAVTVDGFLMKVILFIFVFTINEKFL
ncbi:MAG: hypothetical protein A2X05_15580 [Bacteroidetes bacterium GWE2_41_25]|jgi:hypothetical protein|nr:MAG: hypothetical protein A2X03_16465 [Bacteroidetes bacterium GWA2_40_15]OFY07921.1 MAG: hypothetical protein A2X05_15580 [Bacteroidetes bacterium GWE2_41_25]HBH82394.1 IS982 family transposase [Bacteroidales bacterium]